MQDELGARRLRSLPPGGVSGGVSGGVPAHGPDAGPEPVSEARVEELDALLREVDGLRLSLETDLTLMAAAVEAGRPEVAVELIDGDRAALRSFETQALEHLAGLEHPAAAAPGRGSRWSRITAAPFVAAAALVGLLVGVVPTTFNGPDDLSSTAVSAQSSLAKLTTLAAQGHTNGVRDTAETLHDQINALVAQSADPAAARQALYLLHQERVVIVQSGDGAALQDVLAEAAAIANRIARRLPSSTVGPPPVMPLPQKASEPSKSASPKPRRTSSAAPSTSASPKPRPTASPTASPKPKPTSSPRPSSSPSASPTAGPTGNSNPYPVPGPLG